MKANMKRLCIMVSIVIALNSLSMIVFAEEEQITTQTIVLHEITQEYVDAKFEELFPEYQDRIAACDELCMQNMMQVMNSAELSTLSSENETVTETESVTKVEDDSVYNLTFYSNGGYSRAALLKESVSITFNKGTETTTEWINCKVFTQLSDPGFLTYSGGMIGDTISYTKSGSFKTNGYGNYMNAGVAPGYESDVTFVSRETSFVSVAGLATAYVYIGDLVQQILTKQTILKIQLVKNSTPTITFGYL